MTKKVSEKLRWKAEEEIASQTAEIFSEEHDIKRLLHELQVHQVELEMQNEEMRRAEVEIRSNEARLKSIVNILQYRSETTQQFLDNALNEAIKLMESKIG